MKGNIPLSWSYKDIESPQFHSVNLPLSALPWIYTAEVPANYGIEKLVNQLETQFSKGLLLRGCSSEIASYLQKKNYEIIRTGAEGVLNLDNIDKVSKSLFELATRGSRFGQVKEIALTDANRQRVSSFIEHTPYGYKPHLQYLFNNNFDSNTRCFVMNSFQNDWLGVITVSVSGQNSCHTEMILRNKKAPVGTMESLFVSVMDILKGEGYKSFSLGEVPFVSTENMKENYLESSMKRSLQEYLLYKSGHVLRYAFNYKGLFNFKNKFNPTWKPVYICATPQVPFLSLIDLFYTTGYMDLSRTELTANFKSYYQFSSSSR
ncbi:MAG: phosphatidylglycerol lysyltransferase domain-containing protein [Thermodesulfobacteriota bacterium]